MIVTRYQTEIKHTIGTPCTQFEIEIPFGNVVEFILDNNGKVFLTVLTKNENQTYKRKFALVNLLGSAPQGFEFVCTHDSSSWPCFLFEDQKHLVDLMNSSARVSLRK